jgi:hypothetical protein
MICLRSFYFRMQFLPSSKHRPFCYEHQSGNAISIRYFNKATKYVYNVTLICVRVTVVANEKQ